MNPLRYRGYVYDAETGLYYLQSRYYNPQWGRFINADIFISTGQGILSNNMFAYCLNNPVNMVDSTGQLAISIGALSIGALVVYCVAIVVVAFVAVEVVPEICEDLTKIGTNLSYQISVWQQDIERIIELKMSASLSTAKSNKTNNDHVHHIVAQNDPRAEVARNILEYLFEEGTSLAKNLIPLNPDFHLRLHTNAYYDLVNGIIGNAF